MENDWNQKPLSQAVADIGPVPTSNVLRFPCANSHVANTDFYGLYPLSRDRRYALPRQLKDGARFTAIKARNPVNLLFAGAYYLVFPSVAEAAVYYAETSGRELAGFDFRPKFVPLDEHLQWMSSPFLDASLPYAAARELMRSPSASWRQLFAVSAKSPLLEAILSAENSEPQFTDGAPVPHANFEPLTSYIDFEARKAAVLVRNLPFGLSKHALPRLLWDYDLAPLESVFSCFTTVQSDPLSQTHLTLIRFADPDNARRFVSTFHGRRWQSVQTAKEKRLYEPILCEIVN